jgi:hypothetical protein
MKQIKYFLVALLSVSSQYMQCSEFYQSPQELDVKQDIDSQAVSTENSDWTLLNSAQNIGTEILECSKIFAACIAAASLYGVAQDQITYRHCPEYFTQGFHRRMMNRWNGPVLGTAKQLFDNNPDNPTLRASIWGVIASWWMGALIGIPVTLACRVGPWKKIGYKDLVKPLACTMSLTGANVALVGIQAHQLTQGIDVEWSKYWLDSHGVNTQGVTDYHGFFTDANAHSVAYLVGPLWSCALTGYLLKYRYELSKNDIAKEITNEVSV